MVVPGIGAIHGFCARSHARYTVGEGVERYAYAMVPIDAPGVVVHDDWDALGMPASGSNSVSLEGVELPAQVCAAALGPAIQFP